MNSLFSGRRLLAFLVPGVPLVAAAMALLIWSPWAPRDPVYDGKPLSWWLAQPIAFSIGHPPPQTAGEFMDLFFPPTTRRRQCSADTNAIPVLIRWLRRHSYWRVSSYYRTWIRPKLAARIPKLPLPQLDSRRMNAAFLLGQIRPAPESVIATLTRVLEKDDDAGVRFAAAWSLGKVGQGNQGAMAALTEAAKDKKSFVGMVATSALTNGTRAAAMAVVKDPRP